MPSSDRRLMRPAAIVGGLALILAACSGGGATPTGAPESDEPSASTGGSAAATSSAAAGVDLSGAEFTVGSKEFTEQLILGQITLQVLEGAGATVNDETGLVGSTVVREALVAGDIDMYWEYTGTGWLTHLGNAAPVPGSQEQFDAVKEADAENDIAWLDPAPFNNTYAIALASDPADELGLTTMSDLAAYAAENADGATLCAAAEFLGRDDGLPGLEAAYGFEFSDVSELELGLVYTSIDAGDPCVFGEVFATDGRIAGLGLTVLEDDEEFFPSYLPALNVRQEVLDANPALADLFAPVAEALDNETMTALNARVDVDGEEPADVATAFLEEAGLMGE
ncbi:MAG: glycine betaine ABC transporter substrate-binding protein [Chloroflexi bacterium]|nr:glycine betaine ABC transporter substrate-binding protein [Chloroflexota bacterium]